MFCDNLKKEYFSQTICTLIINILFILNSLHSSLQLCAQTKLSFINNYHSPFALLNIHLLSQFDTVLWLSQVQVKLFKEGSRRPIGSNYWYSSIQIKTTWTGQNPLGVCHILEFTSKYSISISATSASLEQKYPPCLNKP